MLLTVDLNPPTLSWGQSTREVTLFSSLAFFLAFFTGTWRHVLLHLPLFADTTFAMLGPGDGGVFETPPSIGVAA